MNRAGRFLTAAAAAVMIGALVIAVGLALAAIGVCFGFLVAAVLVVLIAGTVLFVLRLSCRIVANAFDAAWRALTHGCF